MPSGNPPLAGVLVLDLTRAVAGPFCTMLLGDLGARVIKIEETENGDETRNWGPPFYQGASAYFLSMNRNKESAAVDLKSESGAAFAKAIASKADVLVENFRPGVADRLGLGYEAMSSANPRLIYCSVSGFGQTGPDRSKPGYDLMMQAGSGLMHASAAEGDPPVKVVFPIADIAASLFAGQAILAALYDRERTGRGRRIDISLLESMLAAMSTVTSPALVTGEPPVRVGTAQPNIVPYQMFRCSDAAIVAGAPNDRLWERFCEALGHPEWLEDPRFQGNANRNRHRPELVSRIEAVFLTRDAQSWLDRLTEVGLPCARVATVLEALANPHLEARGAVATCDHPSLGRLRFVANPMRMEGYTPEYRPPPELGDHTKSLAEEFLGGGIQHGL